MLYPVDPLIDLSQGRPVPRAVIAELDYDGYINRNQDQSITITPTGERVLSGHDPRNPHP